MAQWIDTYKQVPAFNIQVWIRIYTYYGPPVKATRKQHQFLGNYFELDTTNVQVPEWAVLRWKTIA